MYVYVYIWVCMTKVSNPQSDALLLFWGTLIARLGQTKIQKFDPAGQRTWSSDTGGPDLWAEVQIEYHEGWTYKYDLFFGGFNK